jgi:hypothetical protein
MGNVNIGLGALNPPRLLKPEIARWGAKPRVIDEDKDKLIRRFAKKICPKCKFFIECSSNGFNKISVAVLLNNDDLYPVCRKWDDVEDGTSK